VRMNTGQASILFAATFAQAAAWDSIFENRVDSRYLEPSAGVHIRLRIPAHGLHGLAP
jgi:hypothetical protein